jgi:rRNA maturation endonuclease Nob1
MTKLLNMKKLLYILALAILPLYSFAQENLQEKIQQVLHNKTKTDPYKRFLDASDMLDTCYFLFPLEEVSSIYNNILLPFVEKEIKDERKQNSAKAYIYSGISDLYFNRGESEDDATAVLFMKKGIEFAERSSDTVTCAILYKSYGLIQSNTGNISIAHEYLYNAIHLYESLNRYRDIFNCFYNIAENLLQIRDLVGLQKVLEQMNEITKKQPHALSKINLYFFYSVQSAYYSVLSEDYPEIFAYKDSTFRAARNAIYIIENNENEILQTGNFPFAYYNLALAYNWCYPDQYDSVYYFLDRALELRSGAKYLDIELEICVYILYAEVHFAQKKYAQAEKDMLYVLSLLEEVEDRNSVIVEYSEAYKFLVKFYETTNRPIEALKYYKLLLENERKRYDNDKIVAMGDMLVKYEVEKKNEQLDRLQERTQAARKNLILIISLLAISLIALLILVYLLKLRKKNFEQSIYEAALLTELQQNELESIKQRLEQNPIKAVVGKLTEWITNSVIENSKKTAYIQQLSELDMEMLEKGYLATHEKLTNLDMKYIICFAMDMDVNDISLLFNIGSNSIYVIRYRIKRKFGTDNCFKFLM